MSEKTVMLAAGGTGGHIFPAYALAEELGRRHIPVDLVTDMRGDRYGTGFPARKIYRVPSATLEGSSPMAAARTAVTLARGVKSAVAVMNEARPAVVVGFGGYPSFPPLVAARMRGIPTALHEQNAVLGRANRMLAKRVSAIATSFEQVRLLEGEAASKARLTGNPVRQIVLENAGAPYTPSSAGQPFNLLVFGGSQGARYFSDAVPPALAMLPAAEKARLRVVQQCREEDLARVTAAYAEAGIAATVDAFFQNLPQIMVAAHLVIARAGASSVAELAVIGRPSLLVPLPHAVDNDQLANARSLADAGAAICVEQKDLSTARLAADIAQLMTAPADLAGAAAAARARGRPDAVARLADLVQELMA